MASILVHKTYKVNVIITKEASYFVSAVSPEEAEVVVESYIADGEQPDEETIADVIVDDVLPMEEVFENATIQEW